MPMLAFAEALYILQGKKEIELRGLAGTSAGAITATILSLKINPRDFAHNLVSNGDDYVNRITKNYRGNRIRRLYCMTKALLFSETIADVQELRNILLEAIKSLDNEFSESTEMGVARVPVKLVTSNLLKAEKEIICSVNNPSDSVLESLVNSCALPVFFRNHKSLTGGPLVDGGLYNNFPVEEICGDLENNVVGVTFEKPNATPRINTSISYLLHLLLSTVDSSVKQSQGQLAGEDLLYVKTELTTLDFEKAMRFKPGSVEYEGVKDTAIRDLREYVEKKNSRLRSRSILELLRDNEKLYELNHLNVKRKNIHTTVVATLSVLAPVGDARYSKYSEVSVKTRFSAIDEPISAFALSTYEPVEFEPLVEFIIDVVDEHHNKVGFTQIPGARKVREDGGENEYISTILYFHRKLEPDSQTSKYYEVTKTDYALDGMIELASEIENEREQEVKLGNPGSNVIESANVILHVPQEFSDITARSGSDLKIETLTSSEIHELGPCPGGFKAFGWRASNLQHGEFLTLVVTPLN